MNTLKNKAREAGLWYLAMVLTAPLGIMIVPKLIEAPNIMDTAKNILQHETLFRFGILSSLLCQISFIFLVLALSRLFENVNEKQLKLMRALVFIAVPIAFVNELSFMAILLLLKNPVYYASISLEQLGSFSTFFLEMHQNGIMLVSIFWGLWLLPFGILTYQSGFIPKIFGILLMVNCFAYLVDCSVFFIKPDWHDLSSKILMLPISLGEIAMVLWLLIKGAKEKSI